MDAALIQPTRRRKNCRHLPPEMVEEILLNLPLKSLLRVTSVCKSWNSLIWEPRFTRIHKSRSVLLRRNRFVIYLNFDSAEVATFTAFSSISSDLPPEEVHLDFEHCNSKIVSAFFVSEGPIEHMTDFAGQFEKKPYLRALCDELWCVEAGKHLFLWNPSIRNYRKLPTPLFKFQQNSPRFKFQQNYEFVYGLGYDSVGDDYKILKIARDPSVETELYSLKNNCWRKIESFSSEPYFLQERCEFVGGRFHWIGTNTEDTRVIVTFNLTTEKYEEWALPEYSYQIDVSVLRGKLCVFLNYRNGWFELWVMEEYGVDKSWTKKFDFDPLGSGITYKPLYYYDNGDILSINYERCTDKFNIFLNKVEEGKTSLLKIIVCCYKQYTSYYQGHAFLYVESLISPALYDH